MPLTPAQIVDAATAPPTRVGAGTVRYLGRRPVLTPAERRLLDDVQARGAAQTVDVPPVPVVRRPAERAPLSGADLAWLQGLPADPAAVSIDDAQAVADLHARMPQRTSDARLVAAVADPLAAHLNQRRAEALAVNARAAAPQQPPASAVPALAEAIARTTPALTADEAHLRAQRTLDEAVARQQGAHQRHLAALGALDPANV